MFQTANVEISMYNWIANNAVMTVFSLKVTLVLLVEVYFYNVPFGSEKIFRKPNKC